MPNPANFDLNQYFRDSRDIVQATLDDPEFCAACERATDRISAALEAGKKVLLAGNGGSAADAQHIAGELVARFYYDRPATAGLALTTDSSVLTAVGNDYGYEHIFARQIYGLGNAGDVFIGISTSGRSPNILRAIDAARSKGLTVIGFTGQSGGDMLSHCDICLRAPSSSTPLIQQIHIMAAHAICAAVEQRLFPR